MVWCCHGEELGPFCWSVLAAGIAVFGVHLIDLLSIHLRCSGFAGIQKAVVDQMGSRPPNSDYDLFFGASLALGSALELLLGPATELIVAGCCIKSTFHCMSQSDREMVCCCCVE